MTLSVRLIAICAVLGFVSGCTVTSEEDYQGPPPARDDLGEGPGLISGADGGFYIIGGPDKKKKYSR